jgi:serine/threonine protein kinase
MMCCPHVGRLLWQVSDFGLAHIIHERSASDHTPTPTPSELQPSTRYGTLRYLAPECAPRAGQNTPEAAPEGADTSYDALIARDVYAFGCLLYELLHEKRLFEVRARLA